MIKLKDLLNEAKFSKQQIDIMRKSYSTLSGINPSSPTYKKFIKFLDKLPKDQLKQLANAKIKFVSILAKNRLKGESVNEGQKRDANNLTMEFGKSFQKFTVAVNGLAKSMTKISGIPSDQKLL